MSWSNVPSSRSRATESAVTSSPTSCAMIAMRPGTVNQVNVRFGLNQFRATTRGAAAGRWKRSFSSAT